MQTDFGYSFKMARLFSNIVQIIFLIETVTLASSVDITVNPQDITILKGSQAQFICVVNGLSENQMVQWFRNNKKIAQGTTVVPDLSSSIKIDTDESLGHHNLVINSVRSEDNATKYFCSVYEGSVEKAKSDKAVLIVNEIPNLEYYPNCKQSDKNFYENKNAQLVCVSEKGYPTVKLKWYDNGRELGQTVVESFDTLKVVTTVSVSKQQKEAFFVCSLTTAADPDLNKNCTVGPIHVLYKPTTEIQGQDILYEGTDGVYVCYSDASPEVKDYTWTLPDYLYSQPEKYEYENNRQVLRLIGLTKNDNGTIIECSTSNSQGEDVDRFTIRVNGQESMTLSNGGQGHPTGSSSVNLNKKANSSSTAAMLSVVGGCLLFLASIMAFLLCSIILYTRRQAGLYTGNHVPQPDVYYVPKDSIDATSGSTYQAGKWKRSIATQVPNDLELESITYAEIEEGKKLINNYRTLKSTNIKEEAK